MDFMIGMSFKGCPLTLVVNYIPTEENVANIFMKALHRLKFEGFVERLGLRDDGGKEERSTKP